MLKLQYLGTTRSVWLIGPAMKVGSANNNEVIITDGDVAPLHALIHVSGDDIHIEPVEKNSVYVNETAVEGKRKVELNDVIRVGTKELVVVDPKKQVAKEPSGKEVPVVSSEATVFRTAIDLPDNSDAIAQKASGWMLQGVHKTLKNKRYPLEGTMTLGRSQECELHFSFDRLSRKHAEFKIINGVLFLKDLDSSNGTFHNGEKIKQAKVHPGDTVSFDKLEFIVIGPAQAAAGSVAEANNIGQTVVRSAITPEMLKQAKNNQKGVSVAGDKGAKATGQKTDDNNTNRNILLATAGVVVIGLVVAFFLIS